MKIYRRHEDAAVASDPVSENIKASAVAGTIVVVTVISKATSDCYDLAKNGVKKIGNWRITRTTSGIY